MKTIILAIVLTLVASFAAVAQHNPDAKPLDLNIKGVTYDSTYASVIKLLGKAKKQKDIKEYSTECRDKPSTFRVMEYDGLDIGLMGDIRGRGMKVHSIGLDSAKWKFNGVTIGASETDVVKKFGKPRLRVSNDETADVTYEYQMITGAGATTFYFKDKKLISIQMAEPMC